MEKLTDVEFLKVSEIKPGEVIFLHKTRPPGEYLKCKWADSYCKRNCHLNKKGYCHPIAVVEVRNLPDERIEISFVQMSTTKFGGKRARVYSSPGKFKRKGKSRKYFFKATWHEEITSLFHVPHVYTITVEFSSNRFCPFPESLDHLKGQYPVTGKFFRLEDAFLKTLIKEAHPPPPKPKKPTPQRRQPQTGRYQSPYNLSPYNNLFTILSSPSLHSSTDDNSPTSSATTSIRASDNQISETSQAQRSDTLETNEHREIEESNSTNQ